MRLSRPRLLLPPRLVVPPRSEELKLKLSVPTGKSPTPEAVVPLLVPLLPLLVDQPEMLDWTGLPTLVLPTGLLMTKLLQHLLLLPLLAGSKCCLQWIAIAKIERNGLAFAFKTFCLVAETSIKRNKTDSWFCRMAFSLKLCHLLA